MYELKRLYKIKDAKDAHNFLIANNVKIWPWGYYKDRIKECEDEKCRQRYIGKLIKIKEEFLKWYAFKSVKKSRKKKSKKLVKKSRKRQ